MADNTVILAEIKKAIGAHGAWKLKLRTAISTGASQADPKTVQCDNQCEFGKWLYGPSIDLQTRTGMPYKVIRRLHAEFHETASHVLELALSGRKSDAEALLVSDYTARSEKLVLALNKWRGELS